MAVRKIQFLIYFIFQLSFPLTSSAANTIGTGCFYNSSCTGVNEYCHFDTFFKPSCLLGECRCLPLFTAGSQFLNKYFVKSMNPCRKIENRRIGDDCFGSYNEEIPVAGATCDGGKVKCKRGFDQHSSGCLLQRRFLGVEGSPCQRRQDCPGDLPCEFLSGTCRCLLGSEKFDYKTGTCVPKEHGDRCVEDIDCMAFGLSYKSRPIACINGTCQCTLSGMMASVNRIDMETGRVRRQSICVPEASSTGRRKGFSCSKAVAETGVVTSSPSCTKICASHLVCIPCPEDRFGRGRCRQIDHFFSNDSSDVEAFFTSSNIPEDPSSQASNGSQLDEGTDASPTTTSRTSAYINYPNRCFGGTCPPDLLNLDRPGNKIARIGEDGDLQECDFDLCGNRHCWCKPDFFVNRTTKLCKKKKVLKIGEDCSPQEVEYSQKLPLHTTCRNGKVVCNNYYTEALNNTCRKQIVGSFGSTCSRKVDCINGGNGSLFCDHQVGRCRCFESVSFKWNDDKDLCERREYGDACTGDDECTVYGDLARGGYTYGGGYCNFGRCLCSANFKPANLTYLDTGNELWDRPVYRKKTICVHRSAVTNVSVGQPCTLDPIYYGDNPFGRTRLCEQTAICLRCSKTKNTLITKQQGFCKKIPANKLTLTRIT